ncbi:MAG TPA: hypothetical protein VMT67_11455 [Terriglobales bacterium]|nr:hypothetical protein [Terriglobales bacterium]
MDTTKNWAPERIYLQREQGELGSHTWCEDSVGDDMIEEVAYVRADVAALALDTAGGAVAWQMGTPPVPEGKCWEFIIAVRRAQSNPPGKVAVFSANFANKFTDDGCLSDRSGDEFIADGWYVCGLDMSGEYNEVFEPIGLSEGDEIVGWQELPKWDVAPTPTVAADAAAQPCGVCEGDCGAEASGYACPAQPDESAALIAERDAAIMSTHRQALCIQQCAAHIGPDTSSTIEGLPRAVKRLVDDHAALEKLAAKIHYPECWDTAAYPTLASALVECAAWYDLRCGECAEGSVARAASPQSAGWEELAALIAERDAAIMSTHRQALCIQQCAAHIGPETSATIEGLPLAVKRVVQERDEARATAPQAAKGEIPKLKPRKIHWDDDEEAAPQSGEESDEKFIAEHGHRLAKMFEIDAYDIADRDAQIRERFSIRAAAPRAALSGEQKQTIQRAAHMIRCNTIPLPDKSHCPHLLAEQLDALLTQAPTERTSDDSHRFKNFHRLLCERFDYVHDEKDWRRDQISLIEHIAARSTLSADRMSDGMLKLIEEAANCIAEAVTYEQDGFDSPPQPATQWDYNAEQLAYALRGEVTARKAEIERGEGGAQ